MLIEYATSIRKSLPFNATGIYTICTYIRRIGLHRCMYVIILTDEEEEEEKEKKKSAV